MIDNLSEGELDHGADCLFNKYMKIMIWTMMQIGDGKCSVIHFDNA